MLGFIQNYVNPREYLWQLPLLLVFVSGWLLAGPYVLRRSVTKHTPRPKLKFGNYVVICLLSGMAGFFLGVVVAVLLGTIGERTGADLRLTAACAGGVVAVSASYLVVYAMLNLNARQTLKVGTPALGTVFLLTLVVGVACVIPAVNVRRDNRMFIDCFNNLSYIDPAIREYEAINHGQPPETLQQLQDAKLKKPLPNGITCAAHNAPLFYMPIRSLPQTEQTKKIRICDFRSSHSGGRNWVFTNGNRQHGSEKDFQDLLRLTENADFARSLQAADK